MSFYNNCINVINTWGNFDRPIKVTPSVIKVTLSAVKVTPFDRVTLIGFSFRISLKKLIIILIMEKVELELKANYIVLHSVAWGACVIKHIFQTFKKPPKSISYPVSWYHITLIQLMVTSLLNLNSLV